MMRDLLGVLLEGPEPDWTKKPAVFPSTQHTGRGNHTQSAVNWPKIVQSMVSGRLEKIYKAWSEADKSEITKYVSWDCVSKQTGIPVEEIAAEVKYLQKEHPDQVGLTVDRMGNLTYFKFRGRPVITPVTRVVDPGYKSD